MSRTVAAVAIVAGVFLLFISEALSAPLVQLSRSTRSVNQYTCVHKTTYRKNVWKKCGTHSTVTPPLPAYNSLDIKQRLARSSSPHLQVPEKYERFSSLSHHTHMHTHTLSLDCLFCMQFTIFFIVITVASSAGEWTDTTPTTRGTHLIVLLSASSRISKETFAIILSSLALLQVEIL